MPKNTNTAMTCVFVYMVCVCIVTVTEQHARTDRVMRMPCSTHPSYPPCRTRRTAEALHTTSCALSAHCSGKPCSAVRQIDSQICLGMGSASAAVRSAAVRADDSPGKRIDGPEA